MSTVPSASMITALAFVKGIHLGAVVALVGSLGFVLLVLRASPACADSTGGGALSRADRLLVRAASGCFVLAFASALAWLALHAALAAGSGIGGAVDPDVLARVLGQTSFGRVWRYGWRSWCSSARSCSCGAMSVTRATGWRCASSVFCSVAQPWPPLPGPAMQSRSRRG